MEVIQKGIINKKSALIQVMAWFSTGDKPLPKAKFTKTLHAIWRHQAWLLEYDHAVLWALNVACYCMQYSSGKLETLVTFWIPNIGSIFHTITDIQGVYLKYIWLRNMYILLCYDPHLTMKTQIKSRYIATWQEYDEMQSHEIFPWFCCALSYSQQ